VTDRQTRLHQKRMIELTFDATQTPISRSSLM
jgi:hypothetical protein